MKVKVTELVKILQEFYDPEEEILAFVYSRQDFETLLNESITESHFSRMIPKISASCVDDKINEEVLNAFINTPK